MKKPLKLLCSIMAISLFSASIATPISADVISVDVYSISKTELARSREAANTYIQNFLNEINRIELTPRTRFLISESMQFLLRYSPNIDSDFWNQPLPSDREILDTFQTIDREHNPDDFNRNAEPTRIRALCFCLIARVYNLRPYTNSPELRNITAMINHRVQECVDTLCGEDFTFDIHDFLRTDFNV